MLEIRKIKISEIDFLEEMLFEAIFIPEGQQVLPKEIIFQPDLYTYIKDFGQPHDICFIALNNNEPIAAIWTRLFTETNKGYGFINEQIPELSMAVLQDFRNQGIGYKLLTVIFEELKNKKTEKVSLSVDNRNYAYDFYRKNGFEVIKTDNNSVTMVKNIY
jgi:ribosomal protein S18 acetylase RimI-like enzyme